jgi:hypothetical protein
MRKRFRQVLVAVLAPILAQQAAKAAIYTVGADGACTHQNNLLGALLSAAFSAEADEIRLALNLAYTNQDIHLTNFAPGSAGALTIAGGYADCADTQASGRTVVSGTLGSPVFEVDSTGDFVSDVTFRDLEIRDSGQRGILVQGETDVELDNTTVRENNGGIRVESGAILRMHSGSSVFQNTSTTGGAGISCFQAGLEITGVLQSNSTPADTGGGIYASGCVVSLLAGTNIVNNEAWRGGGLYAEGGSFVQAFGGTFAVELKINEAFDKGGGVYALNSTVQLVGTNVDSNTGGGLFADTGGVITMDRAGGTCGGRAKCSSLSHNRASAGMPDGDGIAARVDAGGEIRLFQTYIEDNDSISDSTTSVIRAVGAGAVLAVEGVSMSANTIRRLFEIGSGAIADIAFVSASENGVPGNPSAAPLFVGNGGVARLNSSVFWPSFFIGFEAGATLAELDCILVSDAAHLAAGATRSGVGDPQFASAATGNLRPAPGSPAVDYCDSSAYAPVHGDGDDQARGFDLAGNPNGSPGVAGGLFDLGFDEVRPLFYDGFESGNTTAWSSASP